MDLFVASLLSGSVRLLQVSQALVIQSYKRTGLEPWLRGIDGDNVPGVRWDQAILLF